MIAGFTAIFARLVVSAAAPAPALLSSMAEVVEDWYDAAYVEGL
ncbi:Putative uncharacterized protein [Moritella viscosa]|uniref:Uncharacterized protein n=1 Tax=Moritella viscosa TaxID=80854 RepID=A0A1K9YYT5_9GAMM|nr:Putative uncharacterized protein [Moritella viscosa]SGY87240.1 Putative uncharacterized protein [Moritella viscosa]SGY87248.1 Putative uncharacterized protein [Moritella viscosa]SGY88781.1 Putative uncharacterized protein [Moritella viscosa]SGY89251.1 Putative uncharacterized protein [Moritella viscosa]